MLGAIDETTEFSSAAKKAAELEPGFCHRMLEFQIQYPRHVAVLRAGVRRNPVALPSGMSGLLARADVIGAGIYVSQVPLGSPRRKCMLAQGLGCSSALPCAEPVFHSLDYRIELVSFRNRRGYG